MKIKPKEALRGLESFQTLKCTEKTKMLTSIATFNFRLLPWFAFQHQMVTFVFMSVVFCQDAQCATLCLQVTDVHVIFSCSATRTNRFYRRKYTSGNCTYARV